MKRIILLCPGIHTEDKKADAWMGGLIHEIHANGLVEAFCRIYHHGWISAWQIASPVFGDFFRRRQVVRFQRWVAKQVQEIDPSSTPDFIGHSFGSYLGHNSMATEGGPKAFFNSVVYMGGIVSSREKFEAEGSHFNHLLNLYSTNDTVVKFAPFGHCGYRGFLFAPKNVRNIDCSPAEHGDYTLGEHWDDIISFLRVNANGPEE